MRHGDRSGFTPLAGHKRIVIKIGSSLLVDTDPAR
jgi:glutamate 5-kinase